MSKSCHNLVNWKITTVLLNSTSFLQSSMDKYRLGSCFYHCREINADLEYVYHNSTTDDCLCLNVEHSHSPLAYKSNLGPPLQEVKIYTNVHNQGMDYTLIVQLLSKKIE